MAPRVLPAVRTNCVGVVFAGSLLLASSAMGAQEPQKPGNYTAHEWGTFTSMVGRDGVVLEGLQREEEALPKFVHDLLKVEEYAEGGGKIPASCVTQKMETPVIYFHTDEPQKVHVSVWFQRGLMTQFFPLPSEVMPQLADARQQRVDMSKVDGSSLAWDLELVPRSQPEPAEVPKVGADHPWAIARQVDAAWVRTCPPGGSPAKVEAEQYVFYRGLGRAQPKLGLRSTAGGAVEVENGMASAIPFAAVLELGARGGRFVVGRPLGAGGRQTFELGKVAFDADREMLSRRLGAAVQHALEATGLFQDEARAMVATWSRSWFQKDGSRVIYVLPREQVDQMLPIGFMPPPKELVRTLVGRLEFITPEVQQEVEQAVRNHDSPDAALRAQATARLQGLDRFLEPQLRNIAQHGSDAAVRQKAERLLAAATR
jgi:hypothetical protein